MHIVSKWFVVRAARLDFGIKNQTLLIVSGRYRKPPKPSFGTCRVCHLASWQTSTAVESSCLPSSVTLFNRIYTVCFTLGLLQEPPTPPPPRSESHSRLLFCRTRILSPGCYCINLKCCGKYPSSVIPPLFSSLLSSPSSWSKDFWS